MKRKLPATQRIGPVRLRATRGPRPDDDLIYWRADFYRDGVAETIWTGWATQEDASREVAELVARAQDPARPKKREDEDAVTTVGDLLEYWAAAQHERGDLSTGTKRSTITAAKRLVMSLSTQELVRLDRPVLERYRDNQLKRGYSTYTLALDLRLLRQAWTWGRGISVVPDRDLPRVALRMGERKEKHTPADEQVEALLDRLEGWEQLAVRLLWATGARIGELSTLRWEDVDLENSTLKVRGKTGTRLVPVHRQVGKELVEAARGRTTGYVLGVEPGTTRNLGESLAEIAKALGQPRWSPHALRRAACDKLYRSGIDVSVAAAILGHSAEVALRHYRRADPGEVKKAATKAKLGVIK